MFFWNVSHWNLAFYNVENVELSYSSYPWTAAEEQNSRKNETATESLYIHDIRCVGTVGFENRCLAWTEIRGTRVWYSNTHIFLPQIIQDRSCPSGVVFTFIQSIFLSRVFLCATAWWLSTTNKKEKDFDTLNCQQLYEVVYIQVAQLWWPKAIHYPPLCVASKPIRPESDFTTFLWDTDLSSMLTLSSMGFLQNFRDLVPNIACDHHHQMAITGGKLKLRLRGQNSCL